MKSAALGGLLLLACGAVACRKPAPVDPTLEAYHAAVLHFAEVSRLTQDLTYRDPRFEPILEALDQIPVGSESKAPAQALADRIRGARALANARQPSSDRMQSEAVAAPAFEPILRLPATGPARRAAAEQTQAAPVAPLATNDLPSGAPVQPTERRALPSWYAGYFGTPAETSSGDDAGAAAGEIAADAKPDLSADASPNAQKKVPPPRRPSAPRVDSGEPPPVFGLPGPAGSALQGLPPGTPE